MAGVAGYSAPIPLPAVPNGNGIGMVLETSQSAKPIAVLRLLRRKISIPANTFSHVKNRPQGSAFYMAGVAGFEPTNAAVKVLCLTA